MDVHLRLPMGMISAIPRAHDAVYEVENPGFAAPSIPRADGRAYEVENPGFAICAPIRGLDVASRLMRRTTTLSLLLGAALALAACGGSDATTTTTAETAAERATTTSQAPSTTAPAATTTLPEVGLEIVPRNYDEFRAQPTACGAQAPEPAIPMQFDSPEDLDLGTDATIAVTMSTSCGDIGIKLDPSLAPETVNSFLFLASEGYFDGTVLHRVIPGYIAQGGDPTATGTGGPGYAVPDEFPPPVVTYDRGVLAMANAGPGTTGSQFFIMLADAGLPPQYSIFGWVTEGLEILDLLQAVPLGQSPTSRDPMPSTPLETIYINSVTTQN